MCDFRNSVTYFLEILTWQNTCNTFLHKVFNHWTMPARSNMSFKYKNGTDSVESFFQSTSRQMKLMAYEIHTPLTTKKEDIKLCSIYG